MTVQRQQVHGAGNFGRMQEVAFRAHTFRHNRGVFHRGSAQGLLFVDASPGEKNETRWDDRLLFDAAIPGRC